MFVIEEGGAVLPQEQAASSGTMGVVPREKRECAAMSVSATEGKTIANDL